MVCTGLGFLVWVLMCLRFFGVLVARVWVLIVSCKLVVLILSGWICGFKCVVSTVDVVVLRLVYLL